MIKLLSTTLAMTFLIFSTSPTYSMSATLKEDSPACLKEEWIKNMTTFITTKDKANYEAFLSQGKCILLGSGLPVTVIESPWVFGRYTSFVYNGVTYWAATDSFNYDQ